MERGCWAPRTLVLAVLLGATLRVHAATGYYPRFSPFFFLCTHHGELEGDGEQGEVLISLHIAGNPIYYVPGQEYHVTISTSTFFDGLLVTGLYTSTSVRSSQSIGGPSAFGFGMLNSGFCERCFSRLLDGTGNRQRKDNGIPWDAFLCAKDFKKNSEK